MASAFRGANHPGIDLPAIATGAFNSAGDALSSLKMPGANGRSETDRTICPKRSGRVFMTSRGIQNTAYVVLLALIIYAWALGT